MMATFELDNWEFIAFNRGPQFKLARHLLPGELETAEEIDKLWERFSEGGRKDRSGSAEG